MSCSIETVLLPPFSGETVARIVKTAGGWQAGVEPSVASNVDNQDYALSKTIIER